MSSKANNFRIGLFVLVGLIILIIGIVIFGGGEVLQRKIYD